MRVCTRPGARSRTSSAGPGHEAGADHVPGRAEDGRRKACGDAGGEVQAYVVWEAQVQQVMLGGVIGDLQVVCTSATRGYLLLRGSACQKFLCGTDGQLLTNSVADMTLFRMRFGK